MGRNPEIKGYLSDLIEGITNDIQNVVQLFRNKLDYTLYTSPGDDTNFLNSLKQ